MRSGALNQDKTRAHPGYWKKITGIEVAGFLQEIQPTHSQPVFLCIGSDQSTGDSLGPLVGTALIEAGYPHVMGTLREPLDSSNLQRRIAELPREHTYIAIDAALGLPGSIGLFQVSNRPIAPGKSIGKKLPPLGDYSIAAIVNATGPRQLHILQTTSLYRVMTMAQQIIDAVQPAYPNRL
jgi:putative sporulation protein YyaC